MAFEYIEEITQTSYTLTGATDESYPSFSIDTQYSKDTKVIYNNTIFSASTTIPKATYYVYNKADNELYIPSEATYLATAIFSPTNEFIQRYIYLDDTDTLYKYIGSTTLTIAPSLIDFTNTSLWQNLGVQLNGYSSMVRYPASGSIYWTDLGAVNTKKAFDNSNSSQTVSDEDEDLVYVFNTKKVDRIALFGLEGTEVIIKAHLTSAPESPDNTVTTTYPLYVREGLHFYEILTAEIKTQKVLYATIPTALTQEITVTIKKAGSYAKVSDITLGKAIQMGVVLDGLSPDIKEYSTYSSDSSATDTYVEGGYRKVIPFTVSVLTKDMDSIIQLLDKRRGKITVYNLDTNSIEGFKKIKGFIRSRPVNYLSNSLKSKINFNIEGRIE